MKIWKALKKVSLLMVLLIVAINTFFIYSLYISYLKKNEDQSLYDMRKYLYTNMNENQIGIWDNPDSIYFAKSQGHAQFKLFGDSEYFASSGFEQGIYSIAVSLNEKYKIATTNIAFSLKNGYYIKNKSMLYFPDQEVEVEYIKISRTYFTKTCSVSAVLSMNLTKNFKKRELNLKIESPFCSELDHQVRSPISFTNLKDNQILFHTMVCAMILLLQIYCITKIDESLARNDAFSQQISIMTVLTVGTFQLFNSFEHFVFSVLGYPYFIVLFLIGVSFLMCFFYMIIKLMSVILQKQVTLEMERNPELSMRTYLLCSYLLCHATILVAFYTTIELSDNSIIYYFWTLAIFPQIVKNCFSEFGFLRSNQHLTLFYFSVIVFAVYQHFYRNNFTWVTAENGFNEYSGFRILILGFFFAGITAFQEAFNIQRMINVIFYGKRWEYFRNFEELRKEKGFELSTYDCNICLCNIETLDKIEDWKQEIENEDLREFVNQNSDRPVMVCPCYHYFHSSCLLTWMCVKMECPTCRSKLVPIL